MMCILYLFLFFLGLEILSRLLFACRSGCVQTMGFFESLIHPEGSFDWRVFGHYGHVSSGMLKNYFRMNGQAKFMGVSEDELISAMAIANKVSEEKIREVYTGAHAYEKYSYRPFVGFELTPNQDLSYAKINYLGVQGNIKTYQKPPNTKRVLILGNSTAFGQGVTEPSKNVAIQLEKILNDNEKNRSSTRWEVINVAIMAARSMTELGQLRVYGPLYNPDHVISISGYADLCFFFDKAPKLHTYNFQNLLMESLKAGPVEQILRVIAKHSYFFYGLYLLRKKIIS